MYIIQATQWFELTLQRHFQMFLINEKPIKYKVTLWSRLNKMPRYIKSNRFYIVVLGSLKNEMYFFYLQVLLITHARDWAGHIFASDVSTSLPNNYKKEKN